MSRKSNAPHDHPHGDSKTTTRSCEKWESVKREQDQKLRNLKSREAQILGQKQQLEEELLQVRIDLASVISGVNAGDVSLGMYWDQVEAEIAAVEKVKDSELIDK